jgi:transcriptional regulator with XRE-family HTH domain
MRLSAYLEARGESQAAFARRAGLDQRTINRICAGSGCFLETADAIVQASRDKPTPKGETVTHGDLNNREHAG